MCDKAGDDTDQKLADESSHRSQFVYIAAEDIGKGKSHGACKASGKSSEKERTQNNKSISQMTVFGSILQILKI